MDISIIGFLFRDKIIILFLICIIASVVKLIDL